MRKLKILGFLVGILVISSCNRTNYPNEIEVVDNLLSRIDSAEKIHAAIDTSGINEGNRIFKQKFNFVKTNYTNTADTLHRDQALLISDYRSLRKPFDRFNNQYKANAEELEFTKKQLLDLRHDLEHNLLEANFVNRLVASEKESAEAAINETIRLERGRQNMIATNERLEPRIDSLISFIKNTP